jgi:hypothetical protein
MSANAATVQVQVTGMFEENINTQPALRGEAFEFLFTYESTTPCTVCNEFSGIYEGALTSASLNTVGDTVEWRASELTDSSIEMTVGGAARGNSLKIRGGPSLFGNSFLVEVWNGDPSKWPATDPAKVWDEQDGQNLPESLSINPLDPTTGFPLQFTLFAGDSVWARTDFAAGFTLSTVPVPPALWLFGSGLLGLIGVARRRAA